MARGNLPYRSTELRFQEIGPINNCLGSLYYSSKSERLLTKIWNVEN